MYGATVTGGPVAGLAYKISTASGPAEVVRAGEVPSGYSFQYVSRGPDGNIYGAAAAGGIGYGTLYQIDVPGAGGSRTPPLHAFSDCDGHRPGPGLTRDAAGNLYVVTEKGRRYGKGVPFRITP